MSNMSGMTAVRSKDQGVGRRTTATGATLSGGTFAGHNRDQATITLTPAVETPTENVFEREFDTSGERAKAYLEELSSHVDDLATDTGWQEYLTTMSGFRNYSFTNRCLIDLQMSVRGKEGASRVAPYSYWEALARKQNPDIIADGGFLQVVKKGEKALSVLGPNTFKETVKDSGGNPVLDENGKPKKREVFLGFSARPVFDISQIESVTLPDDYQTLSEEPPAGFMEDLEGAVAGAGFTLEEEDIKGGALGYTTTDASKRIVVKSGLTPGSRARVLAHELGHVYSGHVDRTDYHTGDGGHRGDMELEADSVSYVLLRANGMSPDVGKANAAYVFGWGRKADKSPEAVRRTGDVVTKAFEKLMTDHNWSNVREATGDTKAREAEEVAAIAASIKAEKDAKRAARKPAVKKRAAPKRKPAVKKTTAA